MYITYIYIYISLQAPSFVGVLRDVEDEVEVGEARPGRLRTADLVMIIIINNSNNDNNINSNKKRNSGNKYY